MDRAIDRWLTEFAAGVGTEWAWQRVPYIPLHIDLLRAYTDTAADHQAVHCPLSAKCVYEGALGCHIASGTETFATLQGLTWEQAEAIIAAADMAPGHDQEIWRRLTAITRIDDGSE